MNGLVIPYITSPQIRRTTICTGSVPSQSLENQTGAEELRELCPTAYTEPAGSDL